MGSSVLDNALCFFPLIDNIDKIKPNILPIKANIIPDKPIIIDHVARVCFSLFAFDSCTYCLYKL